jgi:hypothetical protein
MSLTNNQCPPVLDTLIQNIKDKGGMELNDFRKMLYGLRITEEDIDKIENWFEDNGYIQRVILNDFKKTLYGLRLKEEDVTKIERWLIEKGYVQRVIGGKEKQQRRDYIVFGLLRIEEK